MFTLVPLSFFEPAAAHKALAEVARIDEGAKVSYKKIPAYHAALVYTVSGSANSLPEIYYVLQYLPQIKDGVKILCSWTDGELSMAIARGERLLLANSFKAQDFTTALYFILLALKSLELNSEAICIHFRQQLNAADENTLYSYFKAVKFTI